MVGTGLAVVALGLAIYLFVGLRDARKEIARLTEAATDSDKKTKDLDSGLAAVRGQTAKIAERAGVTEAELEKTAAEAQQLRASQQQKGMATLGGEVVKGEGRRGREQGGHAGDAGEAAARRWAISASRAGSSRATRKSSTP